MPVGTRTITSTIRPGTGSSAGGGGSSGPYGFNFTQSSPATVWTINHNLGYRPAVTVYNAGGIEIEADVVNLSLNTVQVTLNPAAAGSARCS